MKTAAAEDDMDPLDLQLQDVIGDLEVGVVRVIDSPAASSADRGRALNIRATLDRMRDAVVKIGDHVDDATPDDARNRVEALRRRANEILGEEHADDHVDRIDETMNDTIRVMSVVGKWPPNE